MKCLTIELNKTGNQWAVAFTKSCFDPDEISQLVDVWELNSATLASQFDPHFATCLAEIARALHPEEPVDNSKVLLLEAKPGTLRTLSSALVTLTLNKSIISLFEVDFQMEKEVRKAGLVLQRLSRMDGEVSNFERVAAIHKETVEQLTGCTSRLDESVFDNLRTNLNADAAVVKNRIDTFMDRVRCF